MELGLFPGMDERTYRALPAINSSALKQGRRSIAHMRHSMLNPSEPSAAMELGTAVHMALLEPRRFRSTYSFALAEDSDKRTKAWKSFVAECECNGVTPLTWDDQVAIEAMRANVMFHPDAAPLLAAEGKCEYVAVWQDEETGLACKARLDKYVPAALALDLKTTKDAGEEKFAKDVEWLGYFQQLSWYREGFERASGTPTPISIIAVENTAPHCVNVFSLDDETFECGRILNHAVLRQYADAVKAGVFPGYRPGVREIGISDFAKRRIRAGEAIAMDDGSHPF